MTIDTATTEAGRQYAAAHEAHYTDKNLQEALQLYRGVLAAHPKSVEAGYSATQIGNIVVSVVPKQELMDAQVKMAVAQLEVVASDHTDATKLREERAEVDKAWDLAEKQRREEKVRTRAEERRRGF